MAAGPAPNDKAPGALRTIGEVAREVGVQAHVLRYWEEKFPQLRPVKRAGGRRLYRPEDVALVRGIQYLLHDRRLTIDGARKVIQEEGVDGLRSVSPARMDRGTRRALGELRKELLRIRRVLAG